MKPVFWIVVAGAVLAGGYVWYSSQNTPDGLAPVPAIGSETEPQSEPETPADNVEGAVEGAADTASTAVEDAVEDAGIVIQESTEAATDAASEAMTAAKEAATAAKESVAEVVEDAATAATEAVTGTTDTASDLTTSGTSAISSGDLSTLLTVEGFDYDKVVTAIDASSLDATQKLTFKTGLEQARDNPEVLSGLLGQIKTAMGL